MSWQQYVQAAQSLGFLKVTIINRKNYQSLAFTAQNDIATAWKDGDRQVQNLHILRFCDMRICDDVSIPSIYKNMSMKICHLSMNR